MDIEKLLEQEIQVLINGYQKALDAYNKKPIQANLRDMLSAREALEACRSKNDSNGAVSFQNITEVLNYLKKEGWKIERSKIYADRHIIKLQHDGTILKKEADKYADKYLSKRDGSDFEELNYGEKLRYETELAKQKAIQIKHKNEVEKGRYILKSSVEQMLAGRALLLSEGLESFFYNMTPRIVEMVNGKNEQIPELLEFCLKEKEALLNHYASKAEFDVSINSVEETDGAET